MATLQRAMMFGFYSKATDKSNNDVVLIKERIRHEDGEEKSNVRFVYNYKRPFYITKPGYRETHVNKKEYEVLENLNEYTTTQANMPKAISKALGLFSGYPNMRELTKSPYLYGSDISTTSLIKYQYLQKWPSFSPEANVAVLDLETNVLNDEGEPVYGAVTYKDKAILAVTRQFLDGIEDPEKKIKTLFTKYLGKYEKERNIKLYVAVVDNDYALVRKLFAFLHKFKPDFVAIWNMSFDIGKILNVLKKYNVDPAQIFCEPSLPNEYKRFYYKEDQLQKVTASGKVTSKHPADLWHVIDAPASFYIIDAMCFFKANRVREQARHSYSLDAILSEELNLGKLRFEEADQYSGLEWHQYMQKHHKLEYGIYNLFDCISMELLDDKTRDLSVAVLGGIGVTDLKHLKSGPKILADELHFFLKDKGRIIASTSPDMREEEDDLVLGTRDWIVTLPSELIEDTDNAFISDVGNMPSRLYTNVFDVDIASGYPTTEIIMNISKETTVREVCSIDGMTEEEQRRLGVNLTACRSNAIDLGMGFYGLPRLPELLNEYKDRSNKTE